MYVKDGCGKVIDVKYVLCLWTDVDECVEDVTICGPEAVCNNTIGAHICTCNHGYRLDLSDIIASSENPCNGVWLGSGLHVSNNVVLVLP